VSGNLTYNTSTNSIGSWTQNVSQAFELTVDMDAKTTSLNINGSPVANAQNVPFVTAGVSTLDRVSVDLGTTGTQRFGWDDILVTNAAGTVTIFNDSFTGNPVNAPPSGAVVGTWTSATLNGSVLVRSSSGNLVANPVEVRQFGGTNDVRLHGTVSTPPTAGIWKITWKSVMADPGTEYPGFIFAPIVVSGGGGIIASVEYR